MTSPASNPLLQFDGLPLFDQVRPEHVQPAIEQLLAAADQALATVTADDFPADWLQLSATLDVATERLGRAWGTVGHLKSVCDTPELRAAYNTMLPAISDFWTRLGADERLYARYKAIDPATLTTEQQQALKNALRGFVLSGAELQGADKQRYAEIQERMATLVQKFSENALDATDHWALYVNADELDGVPQDVIDATRAAAEAEGRDGHKLTLKLPVYLPLMQFAHSSALREKLYRAYTTRASDQAEGDGQQFDNSAIMAEMLLSMSSKVMTVLGIAASGQTRAHSMHPVHRSAMNSGTSRRNRPLSFHAPVAAGMNMPVPGSTGASGSATRMSPRAERH